MLAALETGGAPARVLGAGDDDGRVELMARGRIELVARESSWVQVRSLSRDYVRTRTLQPGDRLVLPNRNDLSLWTGNAGGLELMVDGRSVGVLGRRGDVLRELALDADQLLRR
jgi:cytoskeleton protein RodZ